jgi:hypothetical protein
VRIGLDLDNTLVCYEDVFVREAKQMGLVGDSWGGSKQQVKKELQSRPGGEQTWQALQGRVYGLCMGHATLFPGVASFLMRCTQRGDEVFIVSHKTEFGHFDKTKTPLRSAAINWMEAAGFFDPGRFNLPRENLFFLETRAEKVRKISALRLDIFVDDLEEVFLEPDFPLIKKILFNREPDGDCFDFSAEMWSEIENEILGPITNDQVQFLCAAILHEDIAEASQLKGQGNSRVYRVTTISGENYALKAYPDLGVDPRPRLRNEVNACECLNSLDLSPKVINYDEDLNLAFFEWIEGGAIAPVESEAITQALDFIKKLKRLFEDSDVEFAEASEACLSGEDLLSQIRHRLSVLEGVNNEELQDSLQKVFMPLWQRAQNWQLENSSIGLMTGQLPKNKQTLSPSDFGFHNALRREDGRLLFLDFEYFGRDDPVKLIADFLWHPAMQLGWKEKRQWISGTLEIFSGDAELIPRLRAMWPLYGIRWALIMLNEFRRDGWRKRVHARQEQQFRSHEIHHTQLNKALAVCAMLEREGLECPYV